MSKAIHIQSTAPPVITMLSPADKELVDLLDEVIDDYYDELSELFNNELFED